MKTPIAAVAAAATLAVATATAGAATLTTYSFPFSTSAGFTVADLSRAASDTAAGVDAGPLTSGGGLLSPSNPKPGLRLREGTNAGVAIDAADYSDALTANDFLAFTVGPDGSDPIAVDDVLVNFYGREPTVTFGLGLFSSVDNFTNLLDSETIVGLGGQGAGASNAPAEVDFAQLTLDAGLSGLAADTQFRVAFVYSGPNGTANDFFAQSLSDANGNAAITVDGTAVIPEPASAAVATAAALMGVVGLRRRRPA